jgi:uncharacterized membrane protein
MGLQPHPVNGRWPICNEIGCLLRPSCPSGVCVHPSWRLGDDGAGTGFPHHEGKGGTVMGTAGWIVLIIVIVAVVAVLALTVGRTQARRRQEGRADSIREEAAERAREIERREAEADEMEAEAQRARAEAEQRVAQAAQMESATEEHRESLQQERAEVDERLQRADRIDPRVAGTTDTERESETAVEDEAVRDDTVDQDSTPSESPATQRSERG